MTRVEIWRGGQQVVLMMLLCSLVFVMAWVMMMDELVKLVTRGASRASARAAEKTRGKAGGGDDREGRGRMELVDWTLKTLLWLLPNYQLDQLQQPQQPQPPQQPQQPQPPPPQQQPPSPTSTLQAQSPTLNSSSLNTTSGNSTSSSPSVSFDLTSIPIEPRERSVAVINTLPPTPTYHHAHHQSVVSDQDSDGETPLSPHSISSLHPQRGMSDEISDAMAASPRRTDDLKNSIVDEPHGAEHHGDGDTTRYINQRNHRTKVLAELLQTERYESDFQCLKQQSSTIIFHFAFGRSYVSGLDILLQQYVRPIQQMAHTRSTHLSEDKLKELFSNIEEIVPLHHGW